MLNFVKSTIFNLLWITIQTVVAHGNGGGFKLDQYMWAYFSKSALAGITPHFNILGIRWGFGIIGKTTFAGIKAARVVEYLHNEYGLDVSTIHGIGFRLGCNSVPVNLSKHLIGDKFKKFEIRICISM